MEGGAAMNIGSLLRNLQGHGEGPRTQLPAAPAFIERRRPAYRCAGCNSWGEKLIFMSNGRDYCLPCARNVYGMFGSRPAGRRHDDITSLDEPAKLTTHQGEFTGAAPV
jgi:hypothetical protein